MVLKEFEARLKSIQEENNDQTLDTLVALLCEIRNHFNQSYTTTFAPGKKGTVWTTIENQNSWRKSTSVEWRIKQNGDVHWPTGKALRFNVFNVTMDILKVEMYLKM